MKHWKKLAFALGVLFARWMFKRQRTSDPLLRVRQAGL
jgi:hypothetical protein